jgi:hypothetical protein
MPLHIYVKNYEHGDGMKRHSISYSNVWFCKSLTEVNILYNCTYRQKKTYGGKYAHNFFPGPSCVVLKPRDIHALNGAVFSVLAMNTCRALDGGEWLTSRPRPIYPRERKGAS